MLRILDIGVGTAVPLYHIWNSLPKNVDLLGVDIDKSYIYPFEVGYVDGLIVSIKNINPSVFKR